MAARTPALLALLASAGCRQIFGLEPPAIVSDAMPDGGRLDAIGDGVGDGDLRDGADAMPGSGHLSVISQSLGAQDINLTSEGTSDWAHWGLSGATGFDHKVGANLISNLSTTPSLNFVGSPLTSSWTNGTPTATASQTTSGVAEHVGGSFSFTVPADTTVRTLKLYAGVQTADARLDLVLSDASATTGPVTASNPTGVTNDGITIMYAAASSGQTLMVTWTDTADRGTASSSFATLLSATLQ